MITRVHVFISGRVQGVFYRISTKEKAEQLGIFGWVRNTADGRVEAVFEAEECSVEEMIAWCWKGPPRAQVRDVKIKSETATGEFKGFSFLYK